MSSCRHTTSGFPAGSQSSFRIDVATPLQGAQSFKDFRFSITASELLGLRGGATRDVQLLRSRNEEVAGDLFRFRNQ